MQSTDPGHLFQTTSQLQADSERSKKLKAAEKVGEPINVSSKVLDLVVRDQEAWTAESGFQARRLDLRTGKTIKLYKGHNGPVTSVTLHELHVEDGTKRMFLFTGSWDKTIKVWDANTGEHLHTLEGHADFIKSLTILPLSAPILLSTSSDRTIRVWDLSLLSSASAPSSIQVIKDHTRPVECAVFRFASESEYRSDRDASEALSVWTGDSLGLIKRWGISGRKLVFKEDIKGHETSVSQLAVTDDGLWSVSMDKTAIFHPYDSSSLPTSAPKITVPHSAYVKSLLPLPEDFPIPRNLILTGSEDEDIRSYDTEALFDRSRASPSELGWNTIRGHCGEVTVMRPWFRTESGDGKKGWYVVSGGLDATIRRWSVEDLLNPPVLDYEPEEKKESSGMTEEEERELAELMSDED